MSLDSSYTIRCIKKSLGSAGLYECDNSNGQRYRTHIAVKDVNGKTHITRVFASEDNAIKDITAANIADILKDGHSSDTEKLRRIIKELEDPVIPEQFKEPFLLITSSATNQACRTYDLTSIERLQSDKEWSNTKRDPFSRELCDVQHKNTFCKIVLKEIQKIDRRNGLQREALALSTTTDADICAKEDGLHAFIIDTQAYSESAFAAALRTAGAKEPTYVSALQQRRKARITEPRAL